MIRLSTGLRSALVLDAGIGAMMNGGIIRVYGGTQPATPDDPAATTLLATITTEGKTFVPGADTVGAGLLLAFVPPSALVKNGIWTLKGVNNGTATWWRWFWSQSDSNLQSTYFPRIDGGVGEGLSFNLQSTEITAATEFDIDSFQLVFPAG